MAQELPMQKIDCFAVATVKTESIAGGITLKFSLCLISLSNSQLCFSGITSPPTPHVLACIPISHV